MLIPMTFSQWENSNFPKLKVQAGRRSVTLFKAYRPDRYSPMGTTLEYRMVICEPGERNQLLRDDLAIESAMKHRLLCPERKGKKTKFVIKREYVWT